MNVEHGHCCHKETGNSQSHAPDYLLIVCTIIIILSYLYILSGFEYIPVESSMGLFTFSVVNLVNTMAWGIAAGIIFIGILGLIPREFVIAVLGRNGSIMRAVLAGVLLDLCSHGILMIGARLYEKGATTGQVIAFLVASPWNSMSLTLILWAMIGFKWMITFLFLSMIIALISGIIFDMLIQKSILPANPNRIELPENYKILDELINGIKSFSFGINTIKHIIINGLLDSRMVMRWILFGVILAALIRTFINPEHFQTYFGPTLAGLGLTLVFATIMEICSEGNLPVAADLLNRANAPGNSLTFLMAGVSTDYTEFMVLKESTGIWKVPVFLVLVTLPQILLTGIILNTLL